MAGKGPQAFRTISEVAEELGLPQHVLRFWETRFTHIKPMKRGGGRRYYRPEDVSLLRGIRALLYGEGYTIRGVQRILKEQGPRAVIGFVRPAAPRRKSRPEAPVVSVGSPDTEDSADPFVMPQFVSSRGSARDEDAGEEDEMTEEAEDERDEEDADEQQDEEPDEEEGDESDDDDSDEESDEDDDESGDEDDEAADDDEEDEDDSEEADDEESDDEDEESDDDDGDDEDASDEGDDSDDDDDESDDSGDESDDEDDDSDDGDESEEQEIAAAPAKGIRATRDASAFRPAPPARFVGNDAGLGAADVRELKATLAELLELKRLLDSARD